MILLWCLFHVETSPAEHRDSCINDLQKTGELVVLLDQTSHVPGEAGGLASNGQ